jgi:hypothetical protein
VNATVVRAAIRCVALAIGFSPAILLGQSLPTPGDGTFKPTITPVAPIDKRGYPITAEATQPEPQFSALMTAGKPTGDSYVIHFPSGDAGGPCINTGKARYLIDNSGTLKFEILADCGNLRRGYDYSICRLGETLRCSEAPSWYFTGRTYNINNDGLAVNGSVARAWKDPGEAPQLLQAMAARIKASKDRYVNGPGVMHGRRISCRSFDPSTRSTMLHVFETTCLVQSLCSGKPDLSGLTDGDVLNLDSSVGRYVKQRSKDANISGWVCWLETH